MTKNAIIHDLAVAIASNNLDHNLNCRLSKTQIKDFYANYLVAVKTMEALDKDEKFKDDPHPKGNRPAGS